MKGLGFRHFFTASRDPQSNELTENFVHTLKSVMHSVNHRLFVELHRDINNLLQYRNTKRATGKIPAWLIHGVDVLVCPVFPQLF